MLSGSYKTTEDSILQVTTTMRTSNLHHILSIHM